MSHSNETHYPISVILTVRDMKTSLAFYRDKLGFQLEGCWPDEQNPMWANLMLDGQSVMMGPNMQRDEVKKWCGNDPVELEQKLRVIDDFDKHKHGVGIATYVMVADIDAWHAQVAKKGVKFAGAPKTQFYGLREVSLEDPDGYQFMFYSNVKLATCQSCSMPMKDAKPGVMYCEYCVDEKGKLKPYETIFEGCVSGYFIPMQKMSRPDAEKAARELLSKQPAWAGRK
ncbi:MAG TPA: VOC family protein [Planctomycetota bacterium]|nr:VOC family protein [Planctomycetota bacterium]